MDSFLFCIAYFWESFEGF